MPPEFALGGWGSVANSRKGRNAEPFGVLGFENRALRPFREHARFIRVVRHQTCRMDHFMDEGAVIRAPLPDVDQDEVSNPQATFQELNTAFGGRKAVLWKAAEDDAQDILHAGGVLLRQRAYVRDVRVVDGIDRPREFEFRVAAIDDVQAKLESAEQAHGFREVRTMREAAQSVRLLEQQLQIRRAEDGNRVPREQRIELGNHLMTCNALIDIEAVSAFEFLNGGRSLRTVVARRAIPDLHSCLDERFLKDADRGVIRLARPHRQRIVGGALDAIVRRKFYKLEVSHGLPRGELWERSAATGTLNRDQPATVADTRLNAQDQLPGRQQQLENMARRNTGPIGYNDGLGRILAKGPAPDSFIPLRPLYRPQRTLKPSAREHRR